MHERRVKRSSLSAASRARWGAVRIAGTAMVARMPMIATTMISSMRVNPAAPDPGSGPGVRDGKTMG